MIFGRIVRLNSMGQLKVFFFLFSIPDDGWSGCEIKIFTDTIHVFDGIVVTAEKLVSQCNVPLLVRLSLFGILQYCRNGNRGSYTGLSLGATVFPSLRVVLNALA